VSLNSARAKARDARREADIKQLQTAIWMYYDKKGLMPPNKTPGSGYCDNHNDFLSELVTEGFLSGIPKDPGNNHYCYYDYGAGSVMGGILVSNLETYSGTSGSDGSCRPWAPDVNWCSTSDNSYYCLCNHY
jgi:hypothetical protein